MSHTLARTAAYASDRHDSLFQTFRRWCCAQRMIAALRRLSDAELKDIGVCRCEIDYIANKHWSANRE